MLIKVEGALGGSPGHPEQRDKPSGCMVPRAKAQCVRLSAFSLRARVSSDIN